MENRLGNLSSEPTGQYHAILTGVASRPYQRKVLVTLTRTEAQMVADIMMRAATSEQVRELVGLPPTLTWVNRTKSVWRKVTKRIERRDEAMRKKQHIREAPLKATTPGDIDVPLEGLY